jgi:predicted site-specific integrase-resolvase
MSLLTQVLVAERYGMRLDLAQLAEILGVQPTTLRNQISAGTCKVPTYVDGGKRYADHRDVAAHFDALRESAS